MVKQITPYYAPVTNPMTHRNYLRLFHRRGAENAEQNISLRSLRLCGEVWSIFGIVYSTSRQSVFRRMLLAVFIFTAGIPVSMAQSLASKNEEGNRLFSQGRFEDAEKAYLEAQGKSPGNPEILYNLGNSLIKQKKYDQGIQLLHQSESNGKKGIKENSWYNTGNAFFSMGKFKEAVDAYKQALKLNPSDQDAKHNLELALLKLKQPESKQQKGNSKQNEQDSSQDSSEKDKDSKQQPNPNDRKNPGSPKEQNEPKKQQPSTNAQHEGTISREQALQMLDALKNRELEDQRKLLERRAKQTTNKKDW
jgi:Ca-activated chloride channel homolog